MNRKTFIALKAPISSTLRPFRTSLAVTVASLLLWQSHAQSQIVTTATWVGTTTPAAWNVGTNWSSAPDYLSGIGAGAIFFGPTANRIINATTAITVGSILANADTNFSNSIAAGGGSLTFDAVDAGPATVTVNGNGIATGNLTISSVSVFNDDVVAAVNHETPSSGAGALNWTGAISGVGGFTKQGTGLMTFGTGAKTYTGPTVIEAGRIRISAMARPQATSSLTVLAGGQLNLIIASGSDTYTLGPGPLNLNGFGPTSGPFAQFPGALRNDRALVTTITNPVVLQSDSLIHVQVDTITLAGSTTLSGGVSGAGGLHINAASSDAFVGSVILTGPGTFEGQTIINSGTLRAASATGAALGGTSAVFINVNTGAGKTGVLELGNQNQISDFAPIFLNGGTLNTGGFSEVLSTLALSTDSIIDLANGSSLLAFENSQFQSWSGTLSIFNWSGNPGLGGGTDQLFFGIDATGLTAQQLDQIIFYTDNGLTPVGGTGEAVILSTGEVVAVPEPTAIVMMLGGFGALLGFQRLRHRH